MFPRSFGTAVSLPNLRSVLHMTRLLSTGFSASSKGRGNRAAGWFSDYLEDQKNSDMKSLVLTGGIKGWVAAGDGFRDRMVELNRQNIEYHPATIVSR